jgi:hypothetical protein
MFLIINRTICDKLHNSSVNLLEIPQLNFDVFFQKWRPLILLKAWSNINSSLVTEIRSDCVFVLLGMVWLFLLLELFVFSFKRTDHVCFGNKIMISLPFNNVDSFNQFKEQWMQFRLWFKLFYVGKCDIFSTLSRRKQQQFICYYV